MKAEACTSPAPQHLPRCLRAISQSLLGLVSPQLIRDRQLLHLLKVKQSERQVKETAHQPSNHLSTNHSFTVSLNE